MVGSNILADMAAYVPALIMRQLAVDPRPIVSPRLDRFPAAVLFADISGFTALTERLARRGPAGIEELIRLLNSYFGHLIDIVGAHGGDVVKFAGDGVLAIWPVADEDLVWTTFRALQCALGIQMTMAPDAWVPDEDELRIAGELKMRIGVGVGELVTAHLGGVFGRWEFMAGGEPLIQTGRAQQRACPGDVVLSPQAYALIRQECEVEPIDNGYVRLTGLHDLLPLRALPSVDADMLSEKALQAYLPRAILVRLMAGHTGWLAESRRATVLFINLPDLHSDAPLEQIQQVMYALQTALYRYEGSINRLGVDEKGPTLLAAFGLPPVAHEDDPLRGVQAALAIQAALRKLDQRAAIGITSGLVFCGAVGSATRREYTVMGTTVNLAARLMQVAAAAQDGRPAIRCDTATYQAVEHQMEVERLAPVRIKGWAEPMPLYVPQGRRAAKQPLPVLPIGYEHERLALQSVLQTVLKRHEGAVVLLEGDAGSGKSLLLADLVNQASLLDIATVRAAGIAIERRTPYHAWRDLFIRLLGLDQLEPADSVQWLAERLADLDPEYSRLAALLNPILGIELPEHDFTRNLESTERALHTRDLLIRLILNYSTQHSLPVGRPLLLQIEDAHWMDSASWSMAAALAQAIQGPQGPRLPILMVLALRPNEEALPGEFQRLREQAEQYLQLKGLSREECRLLIARHLAISSVPDDLLNLVYRRAEGNPYFSIELLLALHDQGVLSIANGRCRLQADDLAGPLPETIQGVIISRLDRLLPAQQMTLKVASVIGVHFNLETLQAIHPVEDERQYLRGYLATLKMAGFLCQKTSDDDQSYAFRQTIIRDVIYNLMLFAQRRELHRRLARWYETRYGSPVGTDAAAANSDARSLEPYYALLAEHWQMAEEALPAIGYLERAAEQALRSGLYRETIDLLRRAIALTGRLAGAQNGASAGAPAGPLISRERRAHWECVLGKAYYNTGRLAESREHLERALAMVDRALPAGRRSLVSALLRQAGYQARLRLPRRPAPPDPALLPQLREAARSYELLGLLFYINNQWLPMMYVMLRGANLAELLGPSPELARAQATLQVMSGALSRHRLARSYQRRAMRIARRCDQADALAYVLQFAGLYRIGYGDWDAAEQSLSEAVELARRNGNHRRLAECQSLRAWIAGARGDFPAAAGLCKDVQTQARQCEDVQAQTWGLLGQAECLLIAGQHGLAMHLLADAEVLLAENLDRARTEEIWAYALMSITGLRQDYRQLARYTATMAARLMQAAPPMAIYALSGYAGVAEVNLLLWERREYRSPAQRKQIVHDAQQACAALRRLALSLPVVRPRYLRCEGLRRWLSGAEGAAIQAWRASLHQAARLAMPYEYARSAYELGRHLRGPARTDYLELAFYAFRSMRASYDFALVRECQGSGIGEPGSAP
jgi:class 3 adenylate cyclase